MAQCFHLKLKTLIFLLIWSILIPGIYFPYSFSYSPQLRRNKNYSTSLDPEVITANILVYFPPDWIQMYSQIYRQNVNRIGFHGIYFIILFFVINIISLTFYYMLTILQQCDFPWLYSFLSYERTTIYLTKAIVRHLIFQLCTIINNVMVNILVQEYL